MAVTPEFCKLVMATMREQSLPTEILEIGAQAVMLGRDQGMTDVEIADLVWNAILLALTS